MSLLVLLMRPLWCFSFRLEFVNTVLDSSQKTRVKKTYHSSADRQIHLDRMIHFCLTPFPNWSSRAKAVLKSLVSEHVWEGRERVAETGTGLFHSQLLTSIVIHQSKAIILQLMKFQFAFRAFRVDIFHIATALW